MCRGKIPFPFPGVKSLTLIAVGVGVAPMIQILRGIFKARDYHCQGTAQPAIGEESASSVLGSEADDSGARSGSATAARPPPKRCGVQRIVLLYGVVSTTAVP